MLNGRLSSSREILSNVIRDNDYSAIDFNHGDVLSWINESLDLIGCPYSLIDSISCITIENHQGMLPCNLHTMNQCSGLSNSGMQFPMRTATHTFHPLFLPNTSTGFGVINNEDPVSYDSNGNPIFNFMSYDDSISKALVSSLATTFQDVTYRIEGNYIYTSFKDDAKILLSYRAFPVDLDGFPLIPDNIKFKQAVQSYIRMKCDYRMWRKNRIERGIYEHSEREWMWYCGAATTAGNIPTIDGMESLKNQWMHLIPRLNEQNKFFGSLGNQEYLTFSQKQNRN